MNMNKNQLIKELSTFLDFEYYDFLAKQKFESLLSSEHYTGAEGCACINRKIFLFNLINHTKKELSADYIGNYFHDNEGGGSEFYEPPLKTLEDVTDSVYVIYEIKKVDWPMDMRNEKTIHILDKNAPSSRF